MKAVNLEGFNTYLLTVSMAGYLVRELKLQVCVRWQHSQYFSWYAASVRRHIAIGRVRFRHHY
jgi:hypothetical protein